MVGKRASGERKNKEGNWDGALGLDYWGGNSNGIAVVSYWLDRVVAVGGGEGRRSGVKLNFLL